MERRRFLKSTLSALACTLISPKVSDADEPATSWVTGYRSPTGAYGVAFIDTHLNIHSSHVMPQRLHGFFSSPQRGDIAVPARRPGTTCFIFRSGGQLLDIQAPAHRHFYGHGIYANDGRHLYLTENDYEQARGVIGIYDGHRDYQRIGEMESGGIGPHEILPYPGSPYLIVANGGIQTHPRTGRAKLNLDTMSANLVLLDPHTGRLIEKAELPDELATLSIRHLTTTRAGDIYFGMQDQFPNLGAPPLIGHWRPGYDVKFLTPPAKGWDGFNGYIGSLKTDRSETLLAATSPRGGTVGVWALAGAAIPPDILALHDVCGVERTNQAKQFVLTSGSGQTNIIEVSDKGLFVIKSRTHDVQFDNHCQHLTT